jgi:hypothetical protein
MQVVKEVVHRYWFGGATVTTGAAAGFENYKAAVKKSCATGSKTFATGSMLIVLYRHCYPRRLYRLYTAYVRSKGMRNE